MIPDRRCKEFMLLLLWGVGGRAGHSLIIIPVKVAFRLILDGLVAVAHVISMA
jgi:hypothetical protein